jgi:hypothetical protein
MGERPACLQISLAVRRFRVLWRFTGMVLPGTSIRVKLVGKTPRTDGTDLHFVVHNGEGKQAISKGYAFIRNE